MSKRAYENRLNSFRVFVLQIVDCSLYKWMGRAGNISFCNNSLIKIFNIISGRCLQTFYRCNNILPLNITYFLFLFIPPPSPEQQPWLLKYLPDVTATLNILLTNTSHIVHRFLCPVPPGPSHKLPYHIQTLSSSRILHSIDFNLQHH